MTNRNVKTTAPPKPFEQDPPIIVGGGGSAYVWIKRSAATLVNDLSTIPSTAPHPAIPSDFIVYKVNLDLGTAFVNKGDGTTGALHRLNPARHFTVFDV